MDVCGRRRKRIFSERDVVDDEETELRRMEGGGARRKPRAQPPRGGKGGSRAFPSSSAGGRGARGDAEWRPPAGRTQEPAYEYDEDAASARADDDESEPEEEDEDEEEDDDALFGGETGPHTPEEGDKVDGLEVHPSLKQMFVHFLAESAKTNKLMQQVLERQASTPSPPIRANAPSSASSSASSHRQAPRRATTGSEALPLDGSVRLFGPGHRANIIARLRVPFFKYLGIGGMLRPYNTVCSHSTTCTSHLPSIC